MRHRRGIEVVLVLCVAVLAGGAARGATWYVATDGSDANPGTAARPWRTVQKAADTAVAGDTVLIRTGTYNERVTVRHSGTPDNYITFTNDEGHKPVLDGTRNSGWWGVLSLHGNDYVRVRGLEIRKNSTGWGVLVEHARGDPKDPATEVELIGLDVHDTKGEAVQIRGNAHHVLVEGCLVHDSPKRSGVDIYQWGGGRPHHVTVRRCTAHGFPGFAGIASEQADDLVVEENTCHDCALGLDIGSGRRNVIRGNVIYRSEDGIALSSNEDTHIYDNVIHDVAEAFYAYYWSGHGEPHARNRWYRNVVYNATWALYEMNSPMTRDAKEGPTSGHQYFNNLFYNIGGRSDYRSPFWWRGVDDVRFWNNTVHMKADQDVFELTRGSKGADFRNNIVCVGGDVTVFDINGGSGASIDHNCYWNRTRPAAAVGAHDVVGDPCFVDAAGADFRLKAGSPCIDAGARLTDCTDDLKRNARPQGKAWDMGACEFTPEGATGR